MVIVVTKLASILLSVLIALALLTHPTFHEFILLLGGLGYLGGFIAGMFFIFTFTVVPSIAALFILADVLNLFPLAILGGLGAMCGDYIIFRFFRGKVATNLIPKKQYKGFLKIVAQSKYFSWLIVLIGAIIIASPFPDELGVALLGVTQFETKKFLPLSFALNTLGIFIIVGVGRII